MTHLQRFESSDTLLEADPFEPAFCSGILGLNALELSHPKVRTQLRVWHGRQVCDRLPRTYSLAGIKKTYGVDAPEWRLLWRGEEGREPAG